MANWIDSFKGKRVWVTGASSGIGAAIVRALGEAGVATLASARREERLRELSLAYPSVSTLRLDLAERESLGEAAARAWDQLGGVDILINNAGVSQRSLFVDADPAALERILEINLISTMRLTHAVASRMVTQGAGHIVTVTSMAAKIPTPQRTAYAAAKSGLHGLIDAMRGELEPQGVALTLIVPGFVRTEISTHAVTESGGEHGRVDPNQEGGHSPESCARETLVAVARGRREALVAMAPKLWVALLLRRVAPGLLWRTLSRTSVT